ncbi:MAG: PIN domain-containing protein [Aeromicrobium sp.]|uniref:TA system VapC family ribonuclease toxin n=1 Tax=Aeromicrobium sp. TaxID=1871063 RepID=UPI0039E70250
MTDRPSYLLDVGVLIALTNVEHVHHVRARRWFRDVEQWATTPFTEAGFVRLMLNPVVAGTTRSASEVFDALRAMRARHGHRFVADDTSLADASVDLSGLVGHRQVTDLHLVNLASRHGLVLATLDARLAKALIGKDQPTVTLI